MPFFHADASLQATGDRILDQLWSIVPGLARNQIAFTWIVYDDPVPVNTGGALSPDEFWNYPIRGFSYRGVECIDPAQMVSVFYLVAAHEWLERSMIAPSAELDRALWAMMVHSSLDAMSLVVDVLTGTTSGPELPEGPFITWQQQRNLINRYYQSLNWTELEAINVNQKLWSDGPYGRERVFMGERFDNRNQLTTDAVARLLHSIMGGVAVSGARSQVMMALLQRSLDGTENPAVRERSPMQSPSSSTIQSNIQPDIQPDIQMNSSVVGFLGEGLPPTARLWAIAGCSDTVRHDAAYVEPPDGHPYLLVVFTEGHARNTDLLPSLARCITAVQIE